MVNVGKHTSPMDPMFVFFLGARNRCASLEPFQDIPSWDSLHSCGSTSNPAGFIPTSLPGMETKWRKTRDDYVYVYDVLPVFM